MSRITNRSMQLLIVPLNSGGTVHLAPGETSRELPAFELADNAAVAKMSGRGMLRVAEHAADAPARAPGARPPGRVDRRAPAARPAAPATEAPPAPTPPAPEDAS